jgi:hypothetical protein
LRDWLILRNGKKAENPIRSGETKAAVATCGNEGNRGRHHSEYVSNGSKCMQYKKNVLASLFLSLSFSLFFYWPHPPILAPLKWAFNRRQTNKTAWHGLEGEKGNVCNGVIPALDPEAVIWNRFMMSRSLARLLLRTRKMIKCINVEQ